MPELPEVETVRRTLAEKILGRIIRHVDIRMEKIVKAPVNQHFADAILDHEIMDIGRRGKYLLMTLSDNKTLVVHLRMTGRWVLCHQEEPEIPHTHVVFTLDDGKQLRYTDIRQFGGMILAPSDRVMELPGLAMLGPEPLDEDFTLESLAQALQRKRTKLKSLLLDQRFLAGLGNIYADEALARAGLHPDRTGNSLNEDEVRRLYQNIRSVLSEGIESRGTSFRDYVDGEGRKGEFQERLWAYGREGEPCRRCGSPFCGKSEGEEALTSVPCVNSSSINS